MTVSSAVAMLGFADLGVGSGVMNAVATGHGKDDNQGIRKSIAVGILLLSTIAIFILSIFFVLYPLIPWPKFFNVGSQIAAAEVAPTVAVIVIVFAFSIPAGIALKVQMGLQLGFFSNIWLAVGSVMGLFAVLGVIFFGGGLPYLAAATVAPPVLVGIFAGFYFFYQQRPNLRPNFNNLKISDAKYLAGTSSLFLVLQISGLVAFQKDNLIVMHYLGAGAVATYAVAFKLFSLPIIIMSLFLNAMWPAYAEANSRGDRQWIFHSFRKSIRYSAILVLPMAVVLLLAGQWIIEKWAGSSVVPSWDLLIGLFFWAVLAIFGGNFAMLLNGLGVIRFQVVTSVIMAIVNIALSVWLVQVIGVSGVIWGSVISLVFFLYLPTAIYLRKYF